MKRNVFLGFLLVGLVVLEWGCRDKYGRGGGGRYPEYRISGIESLKIMELDSNNRVVSVDPDTVSIGKFYIEAHLQQEEVVGASSSLSSTTVNAAPAPSPIPQWDLDSIKIFNLNDTSYNNELTDYFALNNRRSWSSLVLITNDDFFIAEVQNLLYYNVSQFRFYMLKNPDFQGEYLLEITFYNKDGSVFKEKIKPFVLRK